MNVKWDVEDWRERTYTCLLCHAPGKTAAGYSPGWTFEPEGKSSRFRVLCHLYAFHRISTSDLRAITRPDSNNAIEDYKLPDGRPCMTSENRYSKRQDSWKVGAWDSGILKTY